MQPTDQDSVDAVARQRDASPRLLLTLRYSSLSALTWPPQQPLMS